MNEINYLAKIHESDIELFKGADISVFKLGREIKRLSDKFSMTLSEFKIYNTEICVRENAKWIIETLGYIRALKADTTIYNTKQLNNIWKDYIFGKNDKDFIQDFEAIDEKFFEKSHIEWKLCNHLIKLGDKSRFDLEKIAYGDEATYNEIWKYIIDGVKDNRYYISDYLDGEGTDEYRLYYFANALAHNNFRFDKYIKDRYLFYRAIYDTLLNVFNDLVIEYNEYVVEVVKKKNRYWNPQVEIDNYID